MGREERLSALYLKPAGYTGNDPRGGESGSNGLDARSQGPADLVPTWRSTRRPARFVAGTSRKPKYVTLADRYDGKRLNSPNDAVVDSHGAIYFTDPPYGLEKKMEDPKKELAFQGVYRIAPDGKLTLLTKEMERPNGIGLSPDEKTLYVANSHDTRNDRHGVSRQCRWHARQGTRDFQRPRTDRKQRPGSCDGLVVDEHGNVFATVPGGVAIFTPAGKHLGTLITNDRTANVRIRRRRLDPVHLRQSRTAENSNKTKGSGTRRGRRWERGRFFSTSRRCVTLLPAPCSPCFASPYMQALSSSPNTASLRSTDADRPTIGPTDVLVRVAACGICGSDVHGYDGSSGRRVPPIIMGHEAAGSCRRVGAAVDRVTRRRSRDVRFHHLLRPVRCRAAAVP